MKKLKNGLMAVIGTLIWLSACSGDPYAEMKSRELESGERYDSVFLGLEFGMSRKEFFDRCWQLNKQQLVKEGPSNSSVQYALKDELGLSAVMQFYPNFHQEKTYEVQASFYYDGWAPWNRKLYADSLQSRVTNLLAEWYDVEFTQIKGTILGDVFVRMDGNRRIVVGVRDERIVDVSVTDMTVADQVLEDPLNK